MSHSWKASLSINPDGTCPESITNGMESAYAVAIPVMALVAPGPEVTKTQPTLPVARA